MTSPITGVHNAVTSAVATADATTLATAMTLVGALRTALTTHMADASAHAAADTVTTYANVTDGAPAYATRQVATTGARPLSAGTDPWLVRSYIEDLRNAFNAHCERADLHFDRDAANVYHATFVDPSEAAAWVVLNGFKAAINSHFASTRA